MATAAPTTLAVVALTALDDASRSAVQYARTLHARTIAVYIGVPRAEVPEAWAAAAPDVPLLVVARDARPPQRVLLQTLVSLQAAHAADALEIVLPTSADLGLTDADRQRLSELSRGAITVTTAPLFE